MRTIELVSKKELQTKALLKKTPLDSDTSLVITEPTIFKRAGKVVIIYGRFPGEIEPIRQSCKTITYPKDMRTGGLTTESRIFGFRPRNVIRGDFCCSTSLAREFQKEHRLICELGVEFSRLYAQYAPDVYERHLAMLSEKVLQEWKIPNTIFTSGIINKNNSLKYHFDSGNFKDSMSCMLVMRKDISGGGMLSIPEFDLRLDLQDKTFLIFDGQKHLHGVTKIIKSTKLSYRYSIVFYSLLQMRNCLPYPEEIHRIRLLKKARAEKRLDKTRTKII